MRYGLRTLFAALTVFCCLFGYMGYGFNWVRQRQHFIEANKSIFFEWARRSHPPKYESRLLRLFGESHVATIYVTVPTIRIQPDGSEVDVADTSHTVPRIKRLFPEADVIAFPYRVGPTYREGQNRVGPTARPGPHPHACE